MDKYDALYYRIQQNLRAKLAKKPQYQFRGQDQKIPSLQTMECNTSLQKQISYTGTNMLGIATMHKSNAVPVFSQQTAEQISKMRR